MMKRTFTSTLVLAGAAALGYVGVKALLGHRPDAESHFFDGADAAPTTVQIGTRSVSLPIKYYRDDCFLGLFTAAYEPIRALLPSKDLFPVRLPGGRVAVSVFAFNYLETSIGQYGEI